MTSWDIKDKGEISCGVNSPAAMPVAHGEKQRKTQETMGKISTVLVLFLYQGLDINENIIKTARKLLQTRKNIREDPLCYKFI